MFEWSLSAADEPGEPIARLHQKAHGEKLSATLVVRSLGYLCVRLLFHGVPMAGLEISFAKGDIEKETGGEILGESLITSKDGTASLDFLVPTGNYICLIENEPPFLVTTVASGEDPFDVPLPVGRPYYDLWETDIDAAVEKDTLPVEELE